MCEIEVVTLLAMGNVHIHLNALCIMISVISVIVKLKADRFYRKNVINMSF